MRLFETGFNDIFVPVAYIHFVQNIDLYVFDTQGWRRHNLKNNTKIIASYHSSVSYVVCYITR